MATKLSDFEKRISNVIANEIASEGYGEGDVFFALECMLDGSIVVVEGYAQYDIRGEWFGDGYTTPREFEIMSVSVSTYDIEIHAYNENDEEIAMPCKLNMSAVEGLAEDMLAA